jgi:hypothetical protein
MTDDKLWKDAALNARHNERQIECGPVGSDVTTSPPTITARRRSAGNYHKGAPMNEQLPS